MGLIWSHLSHRIEATFKTSLVTYSNQVLESNRLHKITVAWSIKKLLLLLLFAYWAILHSGKTVGLADMVKMNPNIKSLP